MLSILVAGLYALSSIQPVVAAVAGDRVCKGPVSSVNCEGKSYVYEKLAGVGLLPGNGRDKYGDTLGGLGSSAVIDLKSWKKVKGKYTGTLWSLPDRGWNTEGTLNYQPRLHKFTITFDPNAKKTNVSSSNPISNLVFSYEDTILFTDPSGKALTGIDPTGVLNFTGLPSVPAATYTGDGFGAGSSEEGDTRVCLDAEGLVLNDDGSFWISDEYGPFVFLFDKRGKMVTAIRPPDALVPLRNGTESFSAASPPRYDPDFKISPANPTSGRNNNQGFEGLSASADGKTLYVLLQSAAMQDGGDSKGTRRHVRFLTYDVSKKTSPVLVSENVVPLPEYIDRNDGNKTRYAAQSEVFSLSNGQFLFLPRDSGAGTGLEFTESNYRHIDIFDVSKATDIANTKYDEVGGAVSPKGVLASDITPAVVCPWIDFNINSELAKFGLHNGGAKDLGLLNEKWESISLVPVHVDEKGKRKGKKGGKQHEEYYVITLSDNDFVTQDGAMNFGKLPYSDESGAEIQNQALVFKVRISA